MFVISDTHWFHENIVEFCGRPADHDDLMAARWNATVGEDDLVLHLGDVCWMKQQARDRFQRDVAPHLNGIKLLILGNHDVRKPLRRESLTAAPGHSTVWQPDNTHRAGVSVAREADVQFFAACGFRVVNPFSITYGGQRVTFAHYPRDVEDDAWHVHGHIHNNGYGSPHEPHRPWRRRNINVSVEVRNYRPVLLDDLLNPPPVASA